MTEADAAGAKKTPGQMTSAELLHEYHTHGLAGLLEEVRDILTANSGGVADADSERLESILTRIRENVDALSGTNKGGTISRADVILYVQKNLIQQSA